MCGWGKPSFLISGADSTPRGAGAEALPQAVAWSRVAISTTTSPKRAMAISRELGWVMSLQPGRPEP
jgi:hypothetical protein